MSRLCLTVLLSLSCVWAVATEGADKASGKGKKPKITFKGGDGSSMEKAIVIVGAKNEIEGVNSEYAWLKKHHPKWKVGKQALISKKGKKYDILTCVLPNNQKKEVWFDISGFFGKL